MYKLLIFNILIFILYIHSYVISPNSEICFSDNELMNSKYTFDKNIEIELYKNEEIL